MSRGGAFRVFLSELAAVGLDLAAVCGAARVDPRILHDGVPLGLDELTRILERAEVMARDVSLGLHMAERARGRGVLSYVARTQRTVGDGLRAFESFAGSSWGSRGGRAGRAWWCHGLRGVPAGTRASTPRSRVRGGAHGDLVAAQWRPRSRGTLPAPRGGPATEYERVLRCPVRFRQHETGVL